MVGSCRARCSLCFFFFQAEDGIRDIGVTGVQTCALPISTDWFRSPYQEIEKLKSFLDRLQHTWKPEHAAGSSWVEEGTPPSVESSVPTDEETQTQRQIVAEHLLDAAGIKEVRIGDTIEYI